MSRTVLVKARSGYAFALKAGARLRVTDVEGQQVSDLVAFMREDLTERLSQANTRKLNGVVKLKQGHALYSTRCNKLLSLVEDTVGEHDILFSSCSAYDYRVRFGLTEPHASCLAILAEALAPYGIPEVMIPDPFNIFQHSEITPEFSLLTRAPLSRAGDYVVLQAEVDCVVAVSACPQDQNPCNGYRITDILLELPD
jgi:uncharacterized protein